ncbi:MAG TPA: hypothetical protein ENN94_02785 [Geoalkalibacter subterraneus]|uniref:Thioredoxin domain-containing protein n=1 Tax=Geoalkalibacter subterraneus TaxID=483547 RepID=A0A831LMZ6_9BACT|nr:hypothetical protein [Geoalkalibacter subterraneus]
MKKVLLGLIVLLLMGCSEDSATQGDEQATTGPPATLAVPGDEDYALVFFLDPKGGPCRMQDDILQRMSDELAGKVHLRYVSTQEPQDINFFYAHGVRGLPQLMLADAQGREIKRLTPGVKTAEDIRRLLANAGAI